MPKMKAPKMGQIFSKKPKMKATKSPLERPAVNPDIGDAGRGYRVLEKCPVGPAAKQMGYK